MIFRPTPLAEAYVIDLEKRGDDRGFFARVFCEKEFADKGLETKFVQINNSLSEHKGTLRGMHYQLEPHAEVKVVRCVRGSLYDVIIDMREDSPTYRQYFGVKLSAANRTMLYAPRGFAHGFITLEDATEAFYLASNFFSPESERGVRWNDPAVGIQWPIEPAVLSDKDRNHPDLPL